MIVYLQDSQTSLCTDLIYGPAFNSCRNLISTDAFIKACVKDLCSCKSNSTECLCWTVSEYSRQCAHAGGEPQRWENQHLCGRNCGLLLIFTNKHYLLMMNLIRNCTFFCPEQKKPALTTWCIRSAAALALTPAVTSREARCVMSTASMDASAQLVRLYLNLGRNFDFYLYYFFITIPILYKCYTFFLKFSFCDLGSYLFYWCEST